jgi:hypothetical protein
MDGAVFCSECGAAVVSNEALTTQTIKAAVTGQMGAVATATVLPSPAAVQDNWVTLHLLDTGQMLPLAERNEFTIGRASDGQPIMPDIDLSPYQAYSSGVSRLHAVIRRGVSQVVLTDLESANGTFVNGRRIAPNEEQPLAHGDVVALGKLKIQILLKSS